MVTAHYGVEGDGFYGIPLAKWLPYAVARTWHTQLGIFWIWSLNIGLVLMIVLSLLPVGLMQTWASVEHGMWYARSADFMQSPLMTKLRWLRVIGDTVFTFGIFGICWFILGLKTGWSLEGKQVEIVDAEIPEPAAAN